MHSHKERNLDLPIQWRVVPKDLKQLKRTTINMLAFLTIKAELRRPKGQQEQHHTPERRKPLIDFLMIHDGVIGITCARVCMTVSTESCNTMTILQLIGRQRRAVFVYNVYISYWTSVSMAAPRYSALNNRPQREVSEKNPTNSEIIT